MIFLILIIILVLLNLKKKITAKTTAGGTIDVEIMVLLKYFSNFCRNFEMPSINLPTVKTKDYNVKVNEQNFFFNQ